MICLILGKKSKNVSKHNSNVDNSPSWRKNKEEIKSLSSERSSSRNDRKKHKTSKYHHRKRTLKRNRSSYHSSSSDDSDTNYPTYTRVSSSKLRKQSSKLKLRRVSPQNHGSRSSTPLSHSSSRRSDFELKSVKTKALRCEPVSVIRPKEDKWNDFDEMIRRINSNLSTENCIGVTNSNMEYI